MSYSDLIQQDSPAIVWSLNEDPTVTTVVKADNFLYKDGTYNGIYSSANLQSVGFPIVYGGSKSIKIDSSGYIGVPSLNKMSIKDKGNASSIEFWVKIDTTSSSENVIMKKYDVNATSGDVDYATCIYVKNDYITFRLGVTNRYYEVSAPFDSVNKPLHIVATYSPNDITIAINGSRVTKQIFDIDQLFPDFDPVDEYFWFQKPSDIGNMQVDCIALYSYVLPRERCIRHFVYGCGYNIPQEFINYNGAVSYNFSMDTHRPIKSYDYGPGNQWSITDSDNCYINNGILKIKSANEPFVGAISGSLTPYKNSLFTTDGYTFDATSYLELQNANAIVPDGTGGWLFKFAGGTAITSNKTLFYLYSNSSDRYIQCYVNSSNTIIFNINGVETSTGSTMPSTGYFYVGFVKNLTENKIIYGSTPTFTTNTDLGSFSIGDYSIRVGSDNTWSNDATDVIASDGTVVINQYFFPTKLSEIRKIKVSSDITSNYYTAVPNAKQKRFIISSSSTAVISINQQSLCVENTSTTGACRLELGNPLGSSSFTYNIVKAGYDDSGAIVGSATTYNLTDRIITNKTWLNNTTLSNNLDLLTFNITLSTDDLVDRPAHLDYLRLFSFDIQTENSDKYIISNSSPGGNPAKIYGNNGEFAIPDLIETPMLYNGFYSGLNLKNSYAKIVHDISTLEQDNVASLSFMLYIKSGQTNGTYNILNLGTNNTLTTTQAGTIAKGSNIPNVYINGSSASTFKLNQWQHVFVRFTTAITEPTIILGSAGQAFEMNIDQLIIFPIAYSDAFLSNLYALTTGGVSYSKADSENIFKLDDSSFRFNPTSTGKDYLVASLDQATINVDHYLSSSSLYSGATLDGVGTTKTATMSYTNDIYGLDYFTVNITNTATTASGSVNVDTLSGVLTGASIIFPDNSIRTISSVATVAGIKTIYFSGGNKTYSAPSKLTIQNKIKTNNKIEYSKLFILGKRMEVDDYIIVNGTTPYLYKVTAITSNEISNTTQTITFTKQSFVNGRTYFTNGKKYQYFDGTNLTDVTDTKRQKIRTKQYIDAQVQTLTEE